MAPDTAFVRGVCAMEASSGEDELVLLLDAVRVLREENAALRDNFNALVTAHERSERRAASAAAQAEAEAHAVAVRHASQLAQLHQELVAANEEAAALRAEAQRQPEPSPPPIVPGVRDLGLALAAAHTACASLMDENAALKAEHVKLRSMVASAKAELRAQALAPLRRVATRDAAVQAGQAADTSAPQAEHAPYELVAQLRREVAYWHRAASEAQRQAAQQAARATHGVPQRDDSRGSNRSLTRLDDVPEAAELSAYAAHYARR